MPGSSSASKRASDNGDSSSAEAPPAKLNKTTSDFKVRCYKMKILIRGKDGLDSFFLGHGFRERCKDQERGQGLEFQDLDLERGRNESLDQERRTQVL